MPPLIKSVFFAATLLSISNLAHANEHLLDHWDNVLRISVDGQSYTIAEQPLNKRLSQKIENKDIVLDY